MDNILAKQFNTKSLLSYAFPTIIMMLFMSTYTLVDGLFVAQYVGEDALSAINIVMPMINVFLAIGLMFSTGSTAVMGRLMGQGKSELARRFLSLVYLTAITLGVLLTGLFFFFSDRFVLLLGGGGELFDLSKAYLISNCFFAVTIFLQTFSQSFFVLAGKPMLGFGICAMGGITNMVLDYVFIAPNMLNMGIAGAGLATGLGNTVPALFGLIYFSCNRKGTLYFQSPTLQLKLLLNSIINGSSELVSQLSTAVTTLIFNFILLDLVGSAGVASISVIYYVQLVQISIYLGFAIGIAPIISYKFGAGDQDQLSKILSIAFAFIAVASLTITAVTILFSDVAVAIFIPRTSATFAMAEHGLVLFSTCYLFMGFNLLMSSVFTALSNGKVSALLSLSRTFVFLLACLWILPQIWGLNGVWLAVPVAELLAFGLTLYCYHKNKLRYRY